MSFVLRLLRRLRNPRGYVGRDLEGNQFFEYPGVHEGRTKRVVKYAEGRDMWAYVGGQRRLPVQWTAWLTHTRPHPPTLEELEADLERQRRVLYRAALIEARDREEAARVAASQQPAIPRPETPPVQDREAPKEHTVHSSTARQLPSSPPNTDIVPKRPEPPVEQPSPWKPPPPDEPHSWQPRVSVRRGN